MEKGPGEKNSEAKQEAESEVDEEMAEVARKNLRFQGLDSDDEIEEVADKTEIERAEKQWSKRRRMQTPGEASRVTTDWLRTELVTIAEEMMGPELASQEGPKWEAALNNISIPFRVQEKMLKFLVEEHADERGEDFARKALMQLAMQETKAVWESNGGGDLWQEILLDVRLAYIRNLEGELVEVVEIAKEI